MDYSVHKGHFNETQLIICIVAEWVQDIPSMV